MVQAKLSWHSLALLCLIFKNQMIFKEHRIQINTQLFDALEQFINRYNMNFAEEPEYKLNMDYSVYLMYLITRNSFINYDDLMDGYIPLKADYLNRLSKKKHKYHVKVLSKNGFIERSSYMVGKRSFGYKITFFDSDNKRYNDKIKNAFTFHSYEFLSKTSIIKREVTDKVLKRKGIADRKCPHLTKWLNSESIQIDAAGAYKWIDQQESLNFNQKYQYACAVRNLEVGNWYYSREGDDNRLHSNLTNLSANLRQFLTSNGSKLVSLDVKSSQPFFMALIISMILENNTQGKELVEKAIKGRELKSKWRSVWSIMNSKTFDLLDIQEFERFKDNVFNSDIYDWLVAQLDPDFVDEITTDKGEIETFVYNVVKNRKEKKTFKSLRSFAKVLFLEFMYSGLGSTSKNYGAVKKVMPKIVIEFIELFKSCKYTDKKGKKTKREKVVIENSKKRFSAFLQHFEAYIILDLLTKKIEPGHFVTTIHDSIVIEEQYRDEVMENLNIDLLDEILWKVEYWK
jgi:hypothetical protein